MSVGKDAVGKYKREPCSYRNSHDNSGLPALRVRLPSAIISLRFAFTGIGARSPFPAGI